MIGCGERACSEAVAQLAEQPGFGKLDALVCGRFGGTELDVNLIGRLLGLPVDDPQAVHLQALFQIPDARRLRPGEPD